MTLLYPQYLRKETEERGATILYATHIFDGLDESATHLAHMSHGKLVSLAPLLFESLSR